MIFTIASREFKTLFLSPMAWTVLAVLQVILAFLFLTQVEAFTALQPRLASLEDAPGLTDIIVPPLFGNAGIILLLVTPLLTMRLICAERRNKTLSLLLSAPISNSDIILGKYLGILGLMLLIIGLVTLMPLSLLLGAELDLGKLFANSLALLLLVSAFTATGLFMSCVAGHPTVAAMGTFGLLLLLWILDWSTGVNDQRNALFEYLSIFKHFQNIQSGLINSVDVSYFLLFITTFTVLSLRSLDKDRLHRKTRLKNTLITLAILCLLGTAAWLSTGYSAEADITRNSSNSLSLASKKLLASLPDHIQLTAYIKKDPALRSQIAQLVNRYKRHKIDLALVFIDPEAQPEKTRELAIDATGTVIVDYQGRSEKLNFIDESSLTNALLQLANAEERWVTFLTGHGERTPDGIANFDLGQFGKELNRRKIKAQALNLATIAVIPDNSALLVLTAPAVPLLAGEIELIKRYIEQGGNLLLLTDPGNHYLDALQKLLGLRQLPGTLVDSKSKLYGINDPSFVLAGDYLVHPITQGFKTLTVYPVASALTISEETDFKPVVLLKSATDSWTETGPLAGKILFDADGDEKQGPLAFAYSLSRDLGNKVQQRIVVVGDGDFLSNAYLGNVGNLDMGLRMINWLIHDDRFIDIPAKIATDKNLHLSQFSVGLIGFGFLLFIPLLLLAAGFYIWRKRRQR